MTDLELKEIFAYKLDVDPKVKPIDSMFNNKDRVESTNYSPSYQRNYVWDEEKATYFIESIFLGTEIPPIILYETEDGYEVIDGRQRYETILRFLRNELKLKKNGLRKLGAVKGFAGNFFKDLSSKYQYLFLNTKIRIIEFRIKTSNYTQVEEDAIKREIFKRYNTGITPLKSIELDKAIYQTNDLNTFFKDKILEDCEFHNTLNKFFHYENDKLQELLKEVRILLVLNRIPIKYFAIRKQSVVARFYDFYADHLDESLYEDTYYNFKGIVENFLNSVWSLLLDAGIEYNKLISECLYWAFSILDKECDHVTLGDEDFRSIANFIKENSLKFAAVRSSFYTEVSSRYNIIADFFEQKFHVNYKIYLETRMNSEFNQTNRETLTPKSSTEGMTLEDLRINKPEPTSEEVEDICRQMSQNHFLMRPPYQREEVIDRKKASAIIESLLLGLRLPPIFIYNKDGINKEVIDGQQRLLSILGFMGVPYKDEDGIDQHSKKEGFALNLKDGILKDLDGYTFSKLSKKDQRKIQRSELWVVEINGESNKNFDPIDLFVRLNNKPYPIKNDSFEMWNSYISRDVIETVKAIREQNRSWFFLRRSDARMDDENIIATLAYLTYKKLNNSKVTPLDVYKTNRINCRVKAKHEITKVLEDTPLKDLVYSINTLDFTFISMLRMLCSAADDNEPQALMLNKLLATEAKGRRTQQGFYVLWMILNGLSISKKQKEIAFQEISQIFDDMKKDISVTDWELEVDKFRDKYRSSEDEQIFVKVGQIATVKKNLSDYEKALGVFYYEFNSERIISENLKIDHKLNNLFYIVKLRPGFSINYVEAILRSRLVYNRISDKFTTEEIKSLNIPFVDDNVQGTFSEVLNLIKTSETESMKSFFTRILDIMTNQLYSFSQYKSLNFNMIKEMKLLLGHNKGVDANAIYIKASDTKSQITRLMLTSLNIISHEEDLKD